MQFDAKQLLELLPHRPPIVMLEQVVDVVPGERGTGIRHFNAEDTFFQGHFPGTPILPGVYVIEAFAQTAMIVSLATASNDGRKNGQLGLLAKVNEMSFTEKIVPGLKVKFSVTVDRRVGPFLFVSCKATGEQRALANGKLTLKIG